jgi:ABC-2 type transport system ATP-binding protein
VIAAGGDHLVFTYDGSAAETGIADLFRRLGALGIDFRDVATEESSLEDIFVSLLEDAA